MIYFIQAGENKPIKIGWTNSIAGRYKHLQAANYEKLIILHLFEGNKQVETMLHHKARKYHIRGEWFNREILRDKQIIDIISNSKPIKQKSKVKPIKKTYSGVVVNNLKKLRETKGWSREQLARKMNVAVITIYVWEQGKKMHTKNEARLRFTDNFA